MATDALCFSLHSKSSRVTYCSLCILYADLVQVNIWCRNTLFPCLKKWHRWIQRISQVWWQFRQCSRLGTPYAALHVLLFLRPARKNDFAARTALDTCSLRSYGSGQLTGHRFHPNIRFGSVLQEHVRIVGVRLPKISFTAYVIITIANTQMFLQCFVGIEYGQTHLATEVTRLFVTQLVRI